jgi:hypothetical protein
MGGTAKFWSYNFRESLKTLRRRTSYIVFVVFSLDNAFVVV